MSDFNHGGVKLQVQAPSSIPGNQVIPVAVTLTTTSPQTINGIKAQVRAQAREQGISMGNGMGIGIHEAGTTEQTIAQIESRDVFTLAAGEMKTVNLELYINGNLGTGSQSGPLGAGSAVGGVLQALATAAQGFEHISYLYRVHASADVEGVGIGPSDSQAIEILPAVAETPINEPAVENLQNPPALPVTPRQTETLETKSSTPPGL